MVEVIVRYEMNSVNSSLKLQIIGRVVVTKHAQSASGNKENCRCKIPREEMKGRHCRQSSGHERKARQIPRCTCEITPQGAGRSFKVHCEVSAPRRRGSETAGGRRMVDESPLNDNGNNKDKRKQWKSRDSSSASSSTPSASSFPNNNALPIPPASPLAVVPDVYQGSRGRQRGPSAAVAFLCLLGDGGPDSSAPA